MPSVNTVITALVASLAIGAQAGPCRPHAIYSSVTQSQVTTTENTQSSTETSAAYIDAVTKPEIKLPETTPSTSAVQVTSSTEAEYKPTATDEEDTTTAGYTSAESTSAGEETTKSVPSTTSGSLTTESTTESATESATESTTESASTTEETTTSLPSTTSKAEDTTTSSEPKTTLDTITLPPTTTSSEAATTTSKASTTTSEASTPSCKPKSELTCGETGEITAGEGHLLETLPGYTLAQCQDECKKNEDCKLIGLTTGSQCELYDTSSSVLNFEAKAGWYYSVWDACCFEEE